MKATTGAGIETIQGTIGNVTGQKRKSGSALTLKSDPYAKSGEPRSATQQAQNTAYGEAVQAWHALSFMERAGYDILAEAENISGFNYFIRETLTGAEIEMITGEIKAYGGSVAPTGFLLCHGQIISRTTYAALFAILGENYGAGDGITTFGIPEMRGRAPFGAGSPGIPDRGYTGGSEKHTLATNEIPTHTHGSGGSHQHAVAGQHEHSIMVTLNFGRSGSDVSRYTPCGDTNWCATPAAGAHQHATAGNHEHATVGDGMEHNNMPPFIGVEFIIKT